MGDVPERQRNQQCERAQARRRGARGTGPRSPAPSSEIYLLLLIDAQDHIVQLVALRAPSKLRAVEIGDAVRKATPRARCYQLWRRGRKIFELPPAASVH